MTSAAATAGIETEALEARLLARKVLRRVLGGSPLFLRAYSPGTRLANYLEEIIHNLREASEGDRFGAMSDDEFEDVTDQLEKLHAILQSSLATARRVGLDRHFLHRGYFRRIEDSTDRMGAIIEAFRLGACDAFGKLVSGAVAHLPK